MKRMIAILLISINIISLTACTQKAGENEKYQVVAAEYPSMAKYPDESKYTKLNGDFDSDGFDKVYDAWWADRKKQMDQPDGYRDGLDSYLSTLVPQLLSETGGENKACSPINIYMALAMLAEVTDGNSRSQILNLLDCNDINSLHEKASAVWNANYCDDGAVTSILANSLWMNDQIKFKQNTLDSLAKYYYASSFRGEMGSAAYDKALQEWINQQTGGLLEEQASKLSMDPETILALVSTIYFRTKWDGEFSESNTKQDTFHADNGDVTCDFMHQSNTNTYYWSERFSAAAKKLEGSGYMWFIRPDEGITPEELLADEHTMEFLLSSGEKAESKFLMVNLAVPKFDVASDMELKKDLMNLGITDIFDPETADFSPMTDDTAAYLSQAKHAVRVAVDEEGVTAAAYTVMMTAGACAPPEEEVDFILDQAGQYLDRKPTRADVLSVFAGLRPLAAPTHADSKKTKEISRNHKIYRSKSGLLTITGGKWTTYRAMAEDVINQAIVIGGLSPAECVTKNLRVHGYTKEQFDENDWNYVYGSDADKIQKMIEKEPSFAEKLHEGYTFTAAHVVWAAREEFAQNIEDVLARRVRMLFLDARAALKIAPKVASVLAAELGKDKTWEQAQIADFNRLARGYILN